MKAVFIFVGMFLWATVCCAEPSLSSLLADFNRDQTLSDDGFSKEFPVVWNGISAVLSDDAYARRVQRAILENRIPETARERYYEAYSWREKAAEVYADMEEEETDADDFGQVLFSLQKSLRNLMVADYAAALRENEKLDAQKDVLLSAQTADVATDAMFSADYLYDQAVAVFAGVQTAMTVLQREADAFIAENDYIPLVAVENMALRETPEGKTEALFLTFDSLANFDVDGGTFRREERFWEEFDLNCF